MARGILRVLLMGAKGLHNTDLIFSMDPYVVLSYGSQEQRSRVARGEGTQPVWNEKFKFEVSDLSSELRLRIMDRDRFTHDDFVGQASIPLEGVFELGFVRPTTYNVTLRDGTYFGEIRVALKFRSEETLGRELAWEDDDFGEYEHEHEHEHEHKHKHGFM